MTKEQAQFLYDAGNDAGLDLEIRDSYSGRGMFGEETCAVEGDFTMGELLCAVVEYVRFLNEEGQEDIPEMPRSFREDSMGLGIIIY